MNVEIRTEAVQFPEKEYINGIFLAVLFSVCHSASVPYSYTKLSVILHVRLSFTCRIVSSILTDDLGFNFN
jgi:hypothetical protein